MDLSEAAFLTGQAALESDLATASGQHVEHVQTTILSPALLLQSAVSTGYS
jgi:hypothetical protein